MNKLLFASIIMCSSASSIIIVPPAVYLAGVSMLGFIANIAVFLAFWLALKGLINRTYFGKPMHELVSIVFGTSVDLAVMVFSSLIPLLLIRPVMAKEIFLASIISGILCFFLLYLERFRLYRHKPKKERSAIIRSISMISLFVAAITFASASFAFQTRVIHDTPEVDSMEISAAGGKLWFYPEGRDICSIYFEGVLVLEDKPDRDCYLMGDDGEKERIGCPIVIVHLDGFVGREGTLYGAGSCSESYEVSVEESGIRLVG